MHMDHWNVPKQTAQGFLHLNLYFREENKIYKQNNSYNEKWEIFSRSYILRNMAKDSEYL